MIAKNLIRKTGSPGGLPPPRPPGAWRRKATKWGAAEGRPAPVGAGGARSGGSGGREPPRKANFPKLCYARFAVPP